MTTIFEISSIVNLNINDKYETIFIINSKPDSTLAKHLKHFKPKRISPFKYNNYNDNENNCIYAFLDPDDTSKYLVLNNISKLFNIIYKNNYIIDNELTKIILKNNKILKNNGKKLVCFIKLNQ